MDAEWKSVQRLLLSTRKLLQQLEARRAPPSEAEHSLVMGNVNEMRRLADVLHRMLSTQSSVKRTLWQRRVEQLGSECSELEMAYARAHDRKQMAHQQQEQRKALLARRRGVDGEAAQAQVMIDNLYEEADALERSKTMVEELTSIGSSVLEALGDQNALMERVHVRLVDLGNSLGLSRAMMRNIERRTFVDKLLVYGGIVLFSLLLLCVWWIYK